jgi:hypothetical protein
VDPYREPHLPLPRFALPRYLKKLALYALTAGGVGVVGLASPGASSHRAPEGPLPGSKPTPPAASPPPDAKAAARAGESDGDASVPAAERNVGGQDLCSANALAGLHVVVVSGAGTPVCNAQVRLTRDGAPEPLRKYGCEFGGAVEEAGTFDLAVSAPGFQPATVARVVVQRDRCHVTPRDLVVTLHSK